MADLFSTRLGHFSLLRIYGVALAGWLRSQLHSMCGGQTWHDEVGALQHLGRAGPWRGTDGRTTPCRHDSDYTASAGSIAALPATPVLFAWFVVWLACLAARPSQEGNPRMWLDE